jgi:hypothetical protein
MVQLPARADWRVFDVLIVQQQISLVDNKYRADGSIGDA